MKRVDNWKEGNPKVEYEKVTVLYLKDKILEIYVILEKGNKDNANPEEKDNAKYYQEGSRRYVWEKDLIEDYESPAKKYFKYLLHTYDEK